MYSVHFRSRDRLLEQQNLHAIMQFPLVYCRRMFVVMCGFTRNAGGSKVSAKRTATRVNLLMALLTDLNVVCCNVDKSRMIVLCSKADAMVDWGLTLT